MALRLLAAALLLSTASAFVDFGDSILYDEYDLSTLISFPLTECIQAQCKVYVAAPDSSLPILDKIDVGRTTLGKIARDTNKTTGVLAPYMIRIAGEAFITNTNFLFASAPVAVYVVYERAALFNSARVHTPSALGQAVSWSDQGTVTVLSVNNFTVQGTVNEGSLQGGAVYAVGYDTAENNKVFAPSLYQFGEKTSTFSFAASSPLVTLRRVESEEADVDLVLTLGYQESTATPAFITSNGYTGVLSGEVYRSSLYDKSLQHTLTFEKETTVYVEAYLNTFTDHVDVYLDGVEQKKLRGARGTSTYYDQLKLTGRTIEVRFARKVEAAAFLLRFVSDAQPPEEPLATTPESAAAPIATEGPALNSEAPIAQEFARLRSARISA